MEPVPFNCDLVTSILGSLPTTACVLETRNEFNKIEAAMAHACEIADECY